MLGKVNEKRVCTFVIDVPKNEWLTANGTKGMYKTRARKAAALRRRAGYLARSAALPKYDGLVHIVATIHGRTPRRFDPNNVADTTKAIIDGLRDAGVLVDDDYTHVLGPDHRFGEPVRSLKVGYHRVTLTITPHQ